MLPSPSTFPAAQAVFGSLLACFAVSEFVIRAASRRNARGAGAGENRSLVLILVASVGGLVGGFLTAMHISSAAIPFGRPGFFVAGLVVLIAGIALRDWSVIVLGRWFTIAVRAQKGQEVVDRGPYRVVRHPSYTGLLLSCLGIGLCLGNWMAMLVILVPITLAIVYRIRLEEVALVAELGEPYVRYAAGRKRLIPGVW